MCRYLLSQIVFEIFVPFFVRMLQGVEYDSFSILRIDHKYNPVAQTPKLHNWNNMDLKY